MFEMYLYLILFLFQYFPCECVQPYFPRQLVFSTDDGYIIAIDEINQQAYQTLNYSSSEPTNVFCNETFSLLTT